MDNNKGNAKLTIENLKLKAKLLKSNRTAMIVIAICAAVLVICLTVIFVVKTIEKNKADIPTPSEVMDAAESFVEEEIIGSEGELVEVTSAPQLSDLIAIEQLRTVSSTYRSIAAVSDSSGPVYYVIYSASIVCGIDMTQVQYVIDEETQTIRIILPDVQVLSSTVSQDDMEYMFIDHSYDTPEVGAEAQRICEGVLAQELENNTALFETARANTANEVEAMFSPIIQQYYSEYTLEVVYEGIGGSSTGGNAA